MAALLLATGSLVVASAASAADAVDLGGGYSLDCSGSLPVLSFDGEITSDNQGNSTGNTNVYFTLQSSRGPTQEFGPTVVALPSHYSASYTLPGPARYLYTMRVGDGLRPGDQREVTIPERCPWYDGTNPPLEVTADNVAIDTTEPSSATVAFDYSLNTEVPVWAQPTGPRTLYVYIAPPGTRDWIVDEELEVSAPGTYGETFELDPGGAM